MVILIHSQGRDKILKIKNKSVTCMTNYTILCNSLPGMADINYMNIIIYFVLALQYIYV